MPKFSGQQTRPHVSAPVRTTGVVGQTHEGGVGYERDAKSELFLLAVTNMVAEDTFYESGQKRDNRFSELAHAVTAEDPEWIRGFIPVLRNEMQMRSASIVLAAHYVHAGGPNGRQVVDSAMSRADEPAEILAYWAQTYGKNFPQPLKRGVADAVERLYNEYSALRYDGGTRAWRMGDVIDLVHPKPLAPWQSSLFKYLIDTRHNRDLGEFKMTELPVLFGHYTAMQVAVEERREWMLKNGIPKGMSWESLSGWLQGPMDAKAWEAAIPEMGYMALLRNLRNFEDAKISDDSTKIVRDKLTDPAEVAKSRQFPIRFYSAWKATDSLTWGREIDTALDLACMNIPELRGRTLIVVDLSDSMNDRMSGRSEVRRNELAAVFGAALAKRNPSSTLVGYSIESAVVQPARSILQTVDRLIKSVQHSGTHTWQAVDRHFDAHDRIVLLTDEQAHPYGRHGRRSSWGGYDVPDLADTPSYAGTPIYTFNLAGYKMAHIEQGQNGSYAFGGLTDAGFKMIAAIDNLQRGEWPWESK